MFDNYLFWIAVALLFFGTLIYLGNKKKIKKLKPIPYTPKVADLNDEEWHLFALINEHRRIVGLPSLDSDFETHKQTINHTRYMIDSGTVSHDNFSKRAEHMTRRGAASAGEIVGYGYSTVSGFLRGYLKSNSHRKVLEGKHWTHMGISTKMNSSHRRYNCVIFTKFN